MKVTLSNGKDIEVYQQFNQPITGSRTTTITCFIDNNCFLEKKVYDGQLDAVLDFIKNYPDIFYYKAMLMGDSSVNCKIVRLSDFE